MTQPKIALEDLLNAVMLEEKDPNYKTLLRWSKRYPEYREELARFFATWAIQMEIPMDTEVDESQLANLGVSRALNILHRQEEIETKATIKEPQASRLLIACRRVGVSEEELASKVGLDASIITKLDLRRLSDIPDLCVERIAEVLHRPIPFVRPLITGPPVVDRRVRYRSARKPEPKTEDFAAAVRSSSLPRTEQDFWLEAVRKQRERDDR